MQDNEQTDTKLKLVNSVKNFKGGSKKRDRGNKENPARCSPEDRTKEEKREAPGLGLFDQAHLEQIRGLKSLETESDQAKDVTKPKKARPHKNINELTPD